MHVKWHFCCLVITSSILVFTYAVMHLQAPIKKYQLWFESVSSHRCAHFTTHIVQEHFLLFKIKYLRWNNSAVAVDVSQSREGRQHNAISSPVYTSTPAFTISQWCSTLCVSLTIEQVKERERKRLREREVGTKEKPGLKDRIYCSKSGWGWWVYICTHCPLYRHTATGPV